MLGQVRFDCTFISPLTMRMLPNISDALTSPLIEVGNVLAYRHGISRDAPDVSLWALKFYGKATFVVVTIPARVEDFMRRERAT